MWGFATTVVSIILTGLMGVYTTSIARKRDRDDLHTTALKVLLRREIMETHKYHTGKGVITNYEFKDFQETCDVYFKMDGNGMTEKLYKEVEVLPLSKEE